MRKSVSSLVGRAFCTILHLGKVRLNIRVEKLFGADAIWLFMDTRKNRSVNPMAKGLKFMSIDRFILRKLNTCQEEHTRANLVRLFVIRIRKAEIAEEHDAAYVLSKLH